MKTDYAIKLMYTGDELRVEHLRGLLLEVLSHVPHL